MNIADIYKRFTNGRTITLKLSWNPKLLSYLYSIHFFHYTDTLELFKYNREMLGGFNSYSTKENCNLVFSGVNSSEDEITRKVDELMRSKAVYRRPEKEYKEDCEKLEAIFFHLIHNANDAERENSNAYGLFQINKYETGNIAYISICDGGGGISYTLNRKFQNNQAIPYFVDDINTTTFHYKIAMVTDCIITGATAISCMEKLRENHVKFEVIGVYSVFIRNHAEGNSHYNQLMKEKIPIYSINDTYIYDLCRYEKQEDCPIFRAYGGKNYERSYKQGKG